MTLIYYIFFIYYLYIIVVYEFFANENLVYKCIFLTFKACLYFFKRINMYAYTVLFNFRAVLDVLVDSLCAVNPMNGVHRSAYEK